MKITKIPGLGKFGVFIDDLNLNNITDEEWTEIGKIHLESLVTIIRGNTLDHHTYYNLMMNIFYLLIMDLKFLYHLNQH